MCMSEHASSVHRACSYGPVHAAVTRAAVVVVVERQHFCVLSLQLIVQPSSTPAAFGAEHSCFE